MEFEIFFKWELPLKVHGLNGFFREFAGDMANPEIVVLCSNERQSVRMIGNIILTIKNTGTTSTEMPLKDLGYKSGDMVIKAAANSRMSMSIDLSKNHNLYDFTISVSGKGKYLECFA